MYSSRNYYIVSIGILGVIMVYILNKEIGIHAPAITRVQVSVNVLNFHMSDNKFNCAPFYINY